MEKRLKSKFFSHNHSVIVGIDATNISSGGGLTHLSQLLIYANPKESGVKKVIVWGRKSVISKLPNKEWLDLRVTFWAKLPLLFRVFWQQFIFKRLVSSNGCNVIFSPGGTLPFNTKIPMVTMCQNMLPFEPGRALLFGRWSWMRLKMRLLFISQKLSFERASGVIFLSRYAKSILGNLASKTIEIPHGVESRFKIEPRLQRTLGDCDDKSPFRLLYVSVLMPYKHQLEVIYAVNQLRQEGWPLELVMVGKAWGSYGKKVIELVHKVDPHGKFLRNLNHIPFEELHEIYKKADLFIFASSCENLPNILIEAMAAGLPIISSDRGPMPETLGEEGIYFNPENLESIKYAIVQVVSNKNLRTQLAHAAWVRAQQYSWDTCARRTFDFIAYISRNT